MIASFFRAFLSFCSFCCCYIGILSSGYGAILPVLNANDSGAGSLRQAVLDASNGDTILIDMATVIFITRDIVIDKNVAIIGKHATETILDGQHATRLFSIERGDSVYVKGITFRNGNAINGYPANSVFIGGGAFFCKGILRVEDCLFHHNKAGYGGALEINGYGDSPIPLAKLYATRCSFWDNEALKPAVDSFVIQKSGGAIYGDGQNGGLCRMWLSNCTISGNAASASGGGINFASDASSPPLDSLFLYNCTIVNNSAPVSGGIEARPGTVVWLQNTILADNIAPTTLPDMRGLLLSGGNNVIFQSASSPTKSYDLTASSTDVLGQSALLAPPAIAANGQHTHPPLCNSPALDAGNDAFAPASDQRGQTRIGKSDIGAHERNAALDMAITHLGDAGGGSLRQSALLACPGDTLDARNIAGEIHFARPIELNTTGVYVRGNPSFSLIFTGDDSTRLFTVATGVSAKIDYCTFTHAQPALYGGGAILNKGSLSVQHSTFAHNSAQSGGAIANYAEDFNASVSIQNCTFSDNEATMLDGGAIDSRSVMAGKNPTTLLQFCTFAHNKAAHWGGAVAAPGNNAAHFESTLFADNDAATGKNTYLDGPSTLIRNLLTDTSQVGQWIAGANIITANAGILPLGYYDGPTPTHALAAGSPAIDAGGTSSGFTADQRGSPRVFNGLPDIGAYEFDPATAVAPTIIAHGVVLYPNPCAGRCYLTVPAGEKWPVTIRDLRGATVHQGIAAADSPFETATLADGLYSLSAHTTHGPITVTFVVQH